MKKPEYKQEFETAVKHEIEYVFGKRIISARDCIDLSNEIFVKTQKKINSNTLRRFFGLVKADYPPSTSTLSILSKYCGFHSIEDVRLKQKSNKPEIIEQERMLNYVVCLFMETPVEDHHDRTFLSFVKHTIQFLNRDAVLAHKFLHQIIKTKNGQDFYFERFVNIDKLNSYYGDGIRHYLNEKRTDEAFIFGNALLVYKYWMNGNNENLIRQSESLSMQNLDMNTISYSIRSRYYAAKLFHADILSLNAEEILIQIYKFYTSATTNIHKDLVIYFEYVIAEALFLTGHYHDALYYLGQYAKNNTNTGYGTYAINVNNFRLIESLVYYKINKTDEAERVFNEVKPSDFNFLNKKFSSILYLSLSNELKRKNLKSSENREALIEETGFKRLKTIL
jgi:hypothetical protein